MATARSAEPLGAGGGGKGPPWPSTSRAPCVTAAAGPHLPSLQPSPLPVPVLSVPCAWLSVSPSRLQVPLLCLPPVPASAAPQPLSPGLARLPTPPPLTCPMPLPGCRRPSVPCPALKLGQDPAAMALDSCASRGRILLIAAPSPGPQGPHASGPGPPLPRLGPGTVGWGGPGAHGGRRGGG